MVKGAWPQPREQHKVGSLLSADRSTDELGALLTPYDTITHFNNYYEFSLSKDSVADAAKNFKASPWKVQIGGLVDNPVTLTLEDILSQFKQEERIYRLRCVEGWSMVIPWTGFQLSQLLDWVKPQPESRYVRFTTLFDTGQMPGQQDPQFSLALYRRATPGRSQKRFDFIGYGTL